MGIEQQWTKAISASVSLRSETMDRQVWSDTFTGLYHTPSFTSPPATVLDLGCNIGLTSAHYCALWPMAIVVGVEMDHDSAELARLNAPCATIREHAVGGAVGHGSYNPAIRSDSFALGFEGGTEVRVLDLGTTITESFVDRHVDFLKMDIEGAEWDVFADTGWNSMVDTILVELHAEGTSREIVARGIEELNRLGYHARHHRRHPQAVWGWR